jgi:predicted transcriptional regulator
MATRKMTLSIPEDLARKAEALAVRRDTSVSSLVARALKDMVETSRPYEEVWTAEVELMRNGSGMRIGEITWTRDELHER